MPSATVVWLRRDLRTTDNPALEAAIRRGGPVVVAWVYSPAEEGDSAPGGAARIFLHGALLSLSEGLARRGARLVLLRGPSVRALIELAASTGADAVFANRVRDPAVVARDERAFRILEENGIGGRLFEDGVLFPPESVGTSSGGPFRVFTPFWKRCLALPPPETPLPSPAAIPSPSAQPDSRPLPEFGLLPSDARGAGILDAWPAGETPAAERLSRFLDAGLRSYPDTRDLPGSDGTSRLSPYLHFGCLSARQLWYAVRRREAIDDASGTAKGAEAFLRQLGWREFAHHLLVHHPGTVHEPLRPEFSSFPWRDDPASLEAWRQGRTGYPMVDAGMRQLRSSGWMHNRVRMIAASFLVKDLLLPWRDGAAWFLEALADADLANNTLGWQWVAGCGADASPFHRVFNPVLQGEKFDPRGDYVRAWIPELAALPDRWIHRPWQAPPSVLSEAGVTLGKTYPERIVDHAAARLRALASLPRRAPSSAGDRK